MIRLLNIVGARPQIIKSSAISRCIRDHFHDKISDIIVHTGQHYDHNMSSVFFQELAIPEPTHNLGIGSSSHARQTADMMVGLEQLMISEKPDIVVLYGDTNSTLAGAVAASKLHVPVAHVEAGLRSWNKSMPEEINRIVCDHTSTLLFCPTKASIDNLIREGFEYPAQPPYSSDKPGIFHSGDVMFDNSIHFADEAESDLSIIHDNKLTPGNFVLVTLHRDFNTDNPERLDTIFKAIYEIAESDRVDFIIPLHPRTIKAMNSNLKEEFHDRLKSNPRIKIVEPVSFLSMINLEKNARLIMTDSGGVQKEAYFFAKPCLILRSESEWVELVESGNAMIVDADFNKILNGFDHYKEGSKFDFDALYGDGNASRIICDEILQFCQ
ncbi:MAG: UDP-N-acetylglucosamine 2-epimerase (non-hydrolyzing) [Bacteroidales bacterium]|nr:UDP-N-acetylglucosamine 2-epimerase (non-hydrolyzing) [Bacteroidales bacterium]